MLSFISTSEFRVAMLPARRLVCILRAAHIEIAIISILKQTQKLGIAKSHAWGHRKNCSQDSKPGLAGVEACVSASIPVHLFRLDVLRSVQRPW